MSSSTPTFTVFTATHNRAHTLERVYGSLCTQTLRDFEWLVVDDGSTDGTAELIARWAAEAEFSVRYVFQPHAGKAAAFNCGVGLAAGALFLALDSDDACVPQALERLLSHWHAIPAHVRGQFTGVTALCMDQHGAVQGNFFARDVLDSDSLELAFRLRDRAERWGFHRTEVLRAHPFPEPEGALFVSESVVWYAIARRYRTRFVNETLRIYHTGDGAPDHLSTLSLGSMRGRLPYHRMVLNELTDWLTCAPLLFLRSALAYSRYSYALGTGARAQLRPLRPRVARVLVACAQPLGWLIARHDRRVLGTGLIPKASG